MSTNQSNISKLPHLGNFVKNKIEEQRLSYAEVCRRINIKQPTISGYFVQESLQTKIIWKLCHALQYNLFADIISHLPENIQNTNTTNTQKIINAQQEEINDLKKEIAIYKEILSKRI
jgi:predicted XRE-type DNA-binding protein